MLIVKVIPWILEIKQKFVKNQSHHPYPNQLMKILNKLESDSPELSLSAIQDLENILEINTEYHWLIMNMLTNLIRTKSVKNREIMQAAITVIAKRDTNQDPENAQIDLSFTDLSGLNLENANLENSNLYQTNLSQANLTHANLSGAILSAANLSSANLNYVNFSGAILSAANLSGSNLTSANLHQANLYLASLKNANLCDTILDGANLREAEFSV